MTLAELRIAALQETGTLASGDPVAPEDDQFVSVKYDAVYQMLLTLGLVAWAADEDIPEYANHPVTMIVAAVIAPAFGVSGQKLNELRLAGMLGMSPPSLAERQLRQQLAKNYVSHPVRVEFF